MVNNNWKNKNVFITGATGFLGSHLTRYLYDLGANIVVLVRDWIPESSLIKCHLMPKINQVKGCVEDYFLLERILNEYEVNTVYHLAAQTIVGIANNNPMSTFETNIKGTWNILEAARRNKVEKIIVSSSDKAYGEHDKLPYEESFSLVGNHPYDVSKSCVDLLCRSYFVTYGFPVCTTRHGNIYGEGDLNFNRIIPGTIRSVLNNERPVIRSDGLYTRDYLYVVDAAMAYVLLAEKMDGLFGEAFNFSLETPINVIDLVNMILELMETNLKPIVLNDVTNEIRHQYLSSQKAKKLLGWKPMYSLREGLKRTIDYYRSLI